MSGCLSNFLIATPVYIYDDHLVSVYIELSSDGNVFWGLGERWGAPGSSFFRYGSKGLPSESMSPIVAWFA